MQQGLAHLHSEDTLQVVVLVVTQVSKYLPLSCFDDIGNYTYMLFSGKRSLHNIMKLSW